MDGNVEKVQTPAGPAGATSASVPLGSAPLGSAAVSARTSGDGPPAKPAYPPPAAVPTQHGVNGMREKISKMPKLLWLTSAEVARIGVAAVESGKVRVVTGAPNKVIAFICKYLPDAVARALVASKAKDFRDTD